MSPRVFRPALEALGWIVAAAISAVVAVRFAAAQGALLYSDGDSVLPVLVAKSIALGQPQDWALSPGLFIPETAAYWAISSLGLGVHASLTLNAVLNFVALYGAIRLVAGKWTSGGTPVLLSLASFGVIAALTFFEGAPGREGFQLASLLAMTTYYSSTVIGTILAVGILRRSIDRSGNRLILPIAILGLVTAICTLNNPLYLGWAVLPILLALAIAMIARQVKWQPALAFSIAVAGGAGIGYAARAAFADLIVAASDNYLKPEQWASALESLGTELLRTPSTIAGIVWLVLVVSAFVCCVAALWLAGRRSSSAEFLVFLVAIISPIVTTAAGVALGSESIRHFQPWVFLPVIALAAFPMPVIRSRIARSSVAWVAGVVAAATLVNATFAMPRLLPDAKASRTDIDLACVVSWVQTSDRIGAGQFWSVRGPMAHLDDPSRLVQVDSNFNRYHWLINRAVDAATSVNFVIQTNRDPAFSYPNGEAPPSTQVNCGRFQILDFGDSKIPLGPPRN